MSKITILGDYENVYAQSSHYDQIKNQGHEVEIYNTPLQTDHKIVNALKDADVVVLMRERTHMNHFVLSSLPKLSLISQTGKGLNHIDKETATNLGIKIVTTEGVSSQSVIELTIGLIIACARQFPLHQENLNSGRWDQLPGIELKGKRLGLIGFGNIGKGVARVANSIGMEVVAWRPRGPKGNEQRDFNVNILSLDEVLSTSDIISIHLRLTPEFVGIINEAKLSLIKKRALFINTSRGELVNERALAKLLENKHLLGAGIDTFSNEPLQDNPFQESTNTVLTPHIGYITYDVLQRFADASLINVERWLNNHKN
ncbi:NAD(P)-dependent oxidoreductase [Halalkalibacter krulwichiae]|uniref:D-3-phosphoglycerate dehydrogenase n=1 Tax=Halalkalibacter krulwichiae TaxID=199441 RepID=A0A1X9MAZ7_9BACI|nr:NAD(P)-dependent oxidoreductase [Halalkalibacter krulwichiae]ARK29760.1 D-3-phosphoglycerate dehydrogenase [Halalkalibacter krulwichiae]